MIARTLNVAFLACGIVTSQAWTDVSFAVQGRPPSGNWPMVYDANLNKSVLVGGTGNTWSFDGSSWVRETPTVDIPHPGQNLYGSQTPLGILDACYDANLRKTLCLWCSALSCPAACRSQSKIFGWDGQQWSELLDVTSTFGSQTPISKMVFDPNRGVTVIYNYRIEGMYFGNGSQTLSAVSNTYTFDGLTLQGTQPLVSPPAGMPMRSFYFDSSRQVCVGLVQAGTLPGYTEWWEWDGARQNWAQSYPALPVLPGTAAYSVANGCAVSLAIDSRSTPPRPYCYKFVGDTAQQLFLSRYPSLRQAPIVYDSLRSRFVLFGGCNGNNCYADTWELQLGPSSSYSFYGAGCAGARGTPSVSLINSGPAIGASFGMQVSNLPLTGPTFMALGFSNATYGPTPLPFDLGPIGAPGCPMLTSPDQLFAVPNVLGVSIWSITIPNLPGVQFYNQAFCLDPNANLLGLIVSNGGSGVIGS